jgi:CTP:molybdopterin cytidylyltransferase MocA
MTSASRLPPPFGPDLKVLVLAGSDTAPRAEARQDAREVPLRDKAFLPLRGRLVIEYVLDLLVECGLTRIWVLAGDEQLARIPGRHRFTGVPQQPGARFFANLLAGSAALQPGPGEPVLVLFGDHPVETPAALRFFLEQCAELVDRADFLHALAVRSSYHEYAAWFSRTSVHTREIAGRASGISLAVPSRLHRIRTLDQLYDVRKLEHPSSMLVLLGHLARWLGASAPWALVDAMTLYVAKEMEKAGRGTGRLAAAAHRLERWLTARVPLRRLEGYAARVLAAERGVRLIPVPHGGLAIDVDFAEELVALEEHWDAIRSVSDRQDAALDRASHGSLRRTSPALSIPVLGAPSRRRS